MSENGGYRPGAVLRLLASFAGETGRSVMQRLQIHELQPLLAKVEQLRSYPATHSVLASVEELVTSASTPSMAQLACERIVSMCNPKAWGDIGSTGFGSKWTDWQDFLGELSVVAARCRQQIYTASKQVPR